jgi:uncharacterized protein YcfJ
MVSIAKTAAIVAALAFSSQAYSQVVFYQGDNYSGRSFSTQRQVPNFKQYGFNDRASSVVVLSERWEVCDGARYDGRCIVLRQGRYPSLAAMGLNDRVSSARSVGSRARYDDDRYAPNPEPVYDNRRRGRERLYQADVTSARAVMSRDRQRCWVEREQVDNRRTGNVGGAVVGAVLGGILGHQIGSGRGQDIATVGGAVAGGAVGYNTNRDRNDDYSRDVERCSSDSNSGTPDYWDVTYNYRGQDHRVQTTYEPGRTISVNRLGEPRA